MASLDFALVLSDSQVELMAFMLGLHAPSTKALATLIKEELPHSFKWFIGKVMRGPLRKNNTINVQPCAWNMLLSRRCASCVGINVNGWYMYVCNV